MTAADTDPDALPPVDLAGRVAAMESRDLRAKRAGAALLAAVLAAPDAELPAAVRAAKRAVMEQETPCE